MDARTKRKLRRKTERELNAQGVDPKDRWYAFARPEVEEYKPPVPGKDFYQETPEALERIAHNKWDENLDEVIAFIKSATNENPYEEDGNTLKPGCIDWSWARNMDCKYINLWIDMRDGGFVLIDGDGERISLDALKWQYRSENES